MPPTPTVVTWARAENVTPNVCKMDPEVIVNWRLFPEVPLAGPRRKMVWLTPCSDSSGGVDEERACMGDATHDQPVRNALHLTSMQRDLAE